MSCRTRSQCSAARTTEGGSRGGPNVASLPGPMSVEAASVGAPPEDGVNRCRALSFIALLSVVREGGGY